MSNYHVEPIDKPQALTKEAIKSLRSHQVQGLSRRQLMRGAIGAGLGLWMTEVLAGTIAFVWPNLTGGFGGAARDRHARDHQDPERGPADRAGLPGLLPRGPRVRDAHRPRAAAVPAGRGHDRRRDGAQRPGAVPALPAPGLQAQPVPQELLVRVPVPRLALRPPRHQGRRRAVRSGAARHGPLLDHRRRRRAC